MGQGTAQTVDGWMCNDMHAHSQQLEDSGVPELERQLGWPGPVPAISRV